MAFMQHVRHQRVQRLLAETPESFTDHLSDHSKTRRVIVNALRAGRHYLTNEEARGVLSDYNIRAIDTIFCDDVDEVLGAFSVERRPMDITLVHEQACHPFQSYSPNQKRYNCTMPKLNSEAAIIEGCQSLLEEYGKHFRKAVSWVLRCSSPISMWAGLSSAWASPVMRCSAYGRVRCCGRPD